jgi:ATP synthase protein I
MLANIAPMARRSATLTAAVAAVMVVISAVVGGDKGVIGAAIAVGVVAVFFGMTALAFYLGAKISPQAMMAAGAGTYFVKILIFFVLLSSFSGSTAFNGLLFGLTVIVCVLAYQAALILTWRRTKMLYVEPDGER